MYFFPGSIAVLTFLAIVRCEEPTPLPVMAKVRVSMGEARLFSEEDVQLTCSVPDDPTANWRFHWFRNGEPLIVANVYDLKKAPVQTGGNYTCKGEKDIDTWPYSLDSLLSEPLHLHVDGGWALLRVPAEPLIIEEAMTLTCDVRDDPMLVDVIFYKDGIEIHKKKDKDLVVTNLTLKDQGSYWCRATWVQRFEYHSALSQPAYVTVLDKLVTPVLKIEAKRTGARKSEAFTVKNGSEVVLRCVTQLNVREKVHSLDYYFLKDDERLGPSTSQETYTILSASEDNVGVYACRVRVRALNLEKWSNRMELNVKK